MANSQQCRICETEGVVTPSDWLVTAQSEVMGFEPGNTFWVCMPCLAGLVLAWVQAQQGTEDPDGFDAEEGPLDVLTGQPPGTPAPPESEPEGPGVLEQIEQAEGTVIPASKNGRGRKSVGGQTDTQTDVPEVEAASADVHE